MNKSMLLKAGLFSLVCLPVFGETTTAVPSSATPPTDQSQAIQNQSPPSTELTPSTPVNPTAATAAAAAAAIEAAPTQEQPSTPAGTPAANSTNNATPPQPPISQTEAPTAPAFDCSYPIPPETTKVDTTIVLQWGQKAAQQTFTFDPSAIDSQLNVLKACYTEQGWQSFNNALQKSGNLDAIRKENLTVSSVIDGQATITSAKNNQWIVIVPIQVVYQNDKEKIAQSLTINLTISRKVSGDLGVTQIVAIPRQTNTNNSTPAPAATSTTSGATATPTTAPTEKMPTEPSPVTKTAP